MSCDQNSFRLLKFSLKFQKMKKNVSNVLAKEADGKTSQAFATLSFLFVCVVIGLPLWWITTTVYRARLPFEDIATLSQSELQYTTEFTVIASSEEVKDDDLVEFKRRLGATLELSSQTSSHSLSFQYKVSVRRTFDFEQEIFSSARSLQELENGLAALTVMSDNGRYSLFLLPASSKLLNHDLHLSGFRYMFAKCNREDWHGLVTPVTDVLRQLLVSEKAVQGALHAAAAASKANRSLEQDKASMRAVRSSPKYDVVLSLLNPRPDLVNAIWEPSHGELQRFLEKLSAFANFTLQSQVLHYAELGAKPRLRHETGTYELAQDDLPRVINAVETRLGSFVSTSPTLHFVVYVASTDQRPLHIVDDTGKALESNAFLSPRWGGIAIYNVPDAPESSPVPREVTLQMAPIVNVFRHQLALLLGIEPTKEGVLPNVGRSPPDGSRITHWEIDVLLRQRAAENLVTATNTLQSLAQLLEEIGNIVIRDDIAEQVEVAVRAVQRAYDLLAQGELQEGFVTSRTALVAAEQAFFDPSLLALLYFPDDQKFAIYIPLFLPVSIPVILSLKHIRNLMRKEKVE